MTFAMKTAIMSRSLDAMKGYLTRSIPGVKSSHRCEALARALGYRTYASLLNAATNRQGGWVTVDESAFQTYLAEHEFSVSSATLFRAVGSGALAMVHDREPRLTVWGMGVGELKRKDNGRWESHRERAARVVAERAAILSDESVEPFLLSLALADRIPATATIRSRPGSYKLKHVAENYETRYPDGSDLGPVYVPNGLFIAAAIHAGFRYKVYAAESGYEDLSVSFNMSKRAIDDLDCEIRPDGALAQDRRRRRELEQFRPLLRYFGLSRGKA